MDARILTISKSVSQWFRPKRRSCPPRQPSLKQRLQTWPAARTSVITEAASNIRSAPSSSASNELALKITEHCLDSLSNGRPADALRLLEQYCLRINGVLEDEAASEQLALAITTHVASANEALEGLQYLAASPSVFQAAVTQFSRQKKYKAVLALEQRAASYGLLSADTPGSKELYFAFIKAYGDMDKVVDARRVFKTARLAGAFGEVPDTRAANTLLNALVSDIDLVFLRARQFVEHGTQLNIVTFNVLLKACMRARDPTRADLAWKWLVELNLQPDEFTFVSLIKSYSYGGDFEKVLQVQQKMDDCGFAPTARIWGSLLVACGTAQQFETALMVWRQLKMQREPISHATYNAMMICCNACGQGERALGVLSEMKSANISPTTTTYNLAIKACESGPGRRPRQEQLWAALGLLAEMQLDVGLKPDAVTFGTLMELCADAKQGRVAQQLYKQMQSMNIPANKIVLTSLLKAVGRAGMVDECCEIFQKMIWGPARMKPNRETFRTVINVLRENGALSQALKVYEGMRKAKHAPSNKEFQELIAVAAETALAQADPQLQAQVASLCNVESLSELDLHNMSSLEARAAVLCVLGMLLSHYQAVGEDEVRHGLTIITGRGEHSADGEPVIRGIVIRLLTQELNLLPSSFIDNASNAGRVEVSREQLIDWLRLRVVAKISSQ